jgi:hypothetical protein
MSCCSSFLCCRKKSALDHELLADQDKDKDTDKDQHMLPLTGSPIKPLPYSPPEETTPLSTCTRPTTEDDLLELSPETLEVLPSANCQDIPNAESYYSEHVTHEGALKVIQRYHHNRCSILSPCMTHTNMYVCMYACMYVCMHVYDFP